MACLSITGSMSTTPSAAMEVMLSLPPLHIFVEACAMAVAYRLNIVGQWKAKGKIVGHNAISKRVGSNPILKMPCDHTSPKFVFEKLYTIQIP